MSGKGSEFNFPAGNFPSERQLKKIQEQAAETVAANTVALKKRREASDLREADYNTPLHAQDEASGISKRELREGQKIRGSRTPVSSIFTGKNIGGRSALKKYRKIA